MVSIIKFADIVLILLFVNCAASIRVIDPPPNGPLVFTKWPPVKHHNKPPSLRHQLMYHMRSNRRVPPGAMRKRFHSVPAPPHPMPQQRVMRPLKMQPMPHYMRKNVVYPVYNPTMSTPQRINFHSSPPGPNTGEYVYENPFTSMHMQPNKKKVSLTGDNKFTPIHTIPAPNLAYAVGNEQIVEPVVDNHLNERENYNVFSMHPPGNYQQQYQMSFSLDDSSNSNNYNIHQYQVTEPSSDQHMVHEPVPMPSADQTIYAQSANQAVPVYKLSPSYEVYNQQSTNNKPIPIPLDTSSLIQLSNTIPQQQLPDTYALPISNQPQLQQHLLQQQSMMQGAPLSPYNPTYLVTQSNNLLSQHRERLFKPAPAFLGTINQPSIDLTPNEVQPFADVNSVASPGQIQQSNQQNQQTKAETTPAPVASNDFLSSVAISTNNFPKFERFTGQRPAAGATNDIIFGQSNGVSQVQQPILTEQEIASYLNYDGTQHNNNQGFIASTYYQTQPDPQIEIDNSQRQQLNDLTISQANAEIRERFRATLTSTVKPNTQKVSTNAHEEHQKKVAQHFGSKEHLRIVVPDESSSSEKKNGLRRSDNSYHNASNLEDVSAEDERELPTHQYYNDDGNDVTTDGGEEYFMHDTESVDRLAMDGETREPFNTSTLAIDGNYY